MTSQSLGEDAPRRDAVIGYKVFAICIISSSIDLLLLQESCNTCTTLLF